MWSLRNYRGDCRIKLCTEVRMSQELPSLINLIHILALLQEFEILTFQGYHDRTVPLYLLGYDILTQWVKIERGLFNIWSNLKI